MICVIRESTIRNRLKEEFQPYFDAIIDELVDNYKEKGESWKQKDWAYLMDRCAVQFEDMINRDDEDFYVNIGCYGGFLWLNDKTGKEEPIDETQESG